MELRNVEYDKYIEGRLPKDSGLIYVGIPFWHPDPWIMKARYQAVKSYTEDLIIQSGEMAIAPIAAYWRDDMAAPAYGWLQLGLRLLETADELRVLKLPGWQYSPGLAVEMLESFGKRPIIFAEPENLSPILTAGSYEPYTKSECSHLVPYALGARYNLYHENWYLDELYCQSCKNKQLRIHQEPEY